MTSTRSTRCAASAQHDAHDAMRPQAVLDRQQARHRPRRARRCRRRTFLRGASTAATRAVSRSIVHRPRRSATTQPLSRQRARSGHSDSRRSRAPRAFATGHSGSAAALPPRSESDTATEPSGQQRDVVAQRARSRAAGSAGRCPAAARCAGAASAARARPVRSSTPTRSCVRHRCERRACGATARSRATARWSRREASMRCRLPSSSSRRSSRPRRRRCLRRSARCRRESVARFFRKAGRCARRCAERGRFGARWQRRETVALPECVGVAVRRKPAQLSERRSRAAGHRERFGAQKAQRRIRRRPLCQLIGQLQEALASPCLRAASAWS